MIPRLSGLGVALPHLSGLDVVFLLLVATAVGLFFALIVGAQGRDGRRWWRSRFGVGWPTLLFLYCLLVVGLWVPVAFGSTFPGRRDLVFGVGGLLFVGGTLPIARAVGNFRSYLLLALTPVAHAGDAAPGRLAVEGRVEPIDEGRTGATVEERADAADEGRTGATDDERVGAVDGGGLDSTGSDGTVPGGTLEAPLSGARAVAYRLKVDTEPADASDRERRRHRETAANVERVRRFAVRDATGAVEVEAIGAELRISADGERTFDPEDDVPDSLSSFLARNDVDRGDATLRCEEATLEPGEDVFVLGRASKRELAAVVVGGREFLVIPGSRDDAVRGMRSLVLAGGAAGVVLAVTGELLMALQTGAL
ncbi:MAG: GIDE domain-containing protein [Salinigranum sp.]